jgi:hypothetical protein
MAEKARLERIEQQRLAAVAWAAKEAEKVMEEARLFQIELASASAATAAAEAIPVAGCKPTAEEEVLMRRHAGYMADCTKRDFLVTRHGLTPSDAEAILAHISPKGYRNSFRKDPMTALRCINKHARENEIRFEDAITILHFGL